MARLRGRRVSKDLSPILMVLGVSIALIENLSPGVRLAALVGGVAIGAFLGREAPSEPSLLVEGPVARGRVRLGLTTEAKILLVAGFVAFRAAEGSDQKALLVGAVATVGALVVNAVVAVVTVRRRIVEVKMPTTATAGREFRADVRVNASSLSSARTTLAGLSMKPTIHRGTDWVRVSASAPRRGVHESVRVIVRDTGPLGLTTATQPHTILLGTALHVVPPVPALDLDDCIATTQSILNDDEVVGLRAAEPGVAIRDVHWPSVLRTGRLIVRQRSTVPPAIDVVVELGTDADEVVGWAVAVGEAFLHGGRRVQLHYRANESFPAPFVLNPDIDIDPLGLPVLPCGPRVLMVQDTVALGHALAGAGPGPVPRPYVDSLITVGPEGIKW